MCTPHGVQISCSSKTVQCCPLTTSVTVAVSVKTRFAAHHDVNEKFRLTSWWVAKGVFSINMCRCLRVIRKEEGIKVEHGSVTEGMADVGSGGKRRKKKKTFGTGDSRVIPNLSTGPARSTLASQFGMGYGACLLGMAECASPLAIPPIYTSVRSNIHNLFHYIVTSHFSYPLLPAFHSYTTTLNLRFYPIRTQLFSSPHKFTPPLHLLISVVLSTFLINLGFVNLWKLISICNTHKRYPSSLFNMSDMKLVLN